MGRVPWRPADLDPCAERGGLADRRGILLGAQALLRGGGTAEVGRRRTQSRDDAFPRPRQCDHQRGMLPNLTLTDYYDRGDVTGAVAKLNGVAGQRPAQTEPVTTG